MEYEPELLYVWLFQMYGKAVEQILTDVVLDDSGKIVRTNVAIESHPLLLLNVTL